MASAAADIDDGPARGWLLRALVVALAFLLFCMPMAAFDIWWHLREGAWIVEHGRVPRVDLWTWGSLGQPYLDQHWGFQIAMWALHATGGVAALVLAKAALGAGAVAAALASVRVGAPPALVALAWLLPLHVHVVRNHVRPETFTLLSVALTLWILRAAAARPRLLWILPPLQVVALNCHAVAVVNLGIVGAYVLQRSFARWRVAAPPPGAGARVEWGVLALVAAAGLVSPYGVAGWLFPLRLLLRIGDDAFWPSVIGELGSPLVYLQPGLVDFFVVAFFAQIALGALSFVPLWRRGRFDLYRSILFVAFAGLALNAERNVSLFALVGGAVTLWNVDEWIATRPALARALAARATERGVAAVLVALMLAVVGGVWQRATGWSRPFGIGETPGHYIHGPARFAGEAGMPERAFVADFGQAAVYSFHNAPARMPFVDGRMQLAQRDTVEAYLRVQARLADAAAMAAGDREILDVLAPEARSDLDWPAIVLDTQRALPQIQGLLQNPEWRLVFADPSGGVFLSRGLAERLDLRTPRIEGAAPGVGGAAPR